MYLDGKPLIHIVDEGKRFSATRFLEIVSTVSLWSAILECWATIYTGLPRKILVDPGSQFGDLFISLGAISNVEVQRTGIESHNSLGLGERYHQPLCNTFRKLKIGYADQERKLLLSFAVKALNDTLGLDGLVPSALVFGEFPSPLTTSEIRHPRSMLESRAEIANKARREMEKEMAAVRVQRALRHATPPAADATFQVGQGVLIWRERRVESRIGEWIGPCNVHSVDQQKKLLFVKDSEDGDPRPFNITQVKPYRTPEQINHSFMSDIRQGLSDFSSPKDEDLFLTEILTPGDPRCSSKEITSAKKAEISNLHKRGTFKAILREESPDNANVLPGSFVSTIKSTEDGQEKFKARYVIGGHRDKLKQFMVHSSQTLQPTSVRLLLAMASMFGFNVWTADVRQAYLQSAEPLMRDIFIKDPVPEFELDASQCLQILRTLCGLCESGDLWHATLDAHHRDDLGMTSISLDSAMYIWVVDGLLKGMSGRYVDDLMRAGDDDFKEHARKTAESFEMANDEEPPCDFTGFRLDVSKDNTLTLDQNNYLMTIRPMRSDAEWFHFASRRMNLLWLTHTRPDCAFDVSQMAQVTKDIFKRDKKAVIRRCNRLVKHVHENKNKVAIPRLDKDSLKVVGFSDASFAGNMDFTSQLGYICFLADEKDAAVPIIFKSYKARRVTRSVMSAEVISFSDMFDVCYKLAHDLKSMLQNREVPIQLYTDSKSLFDVISRGTQTSEKRLMLDIAALEKGLRRRRLAILAS